MTLKDRLEDAASDERSFPSAMDDIAEELVATGAGLEAVETILRFMEAHPEVDFGTPGALTEFAERFCGRGYERLLLDSLRRRPTGHTVTMLGFLINGSKAGREREAYLAALVAAATHPGSDNATREVVEFFEGIAAERGWLL